jgi:hypothetical protein
MVWRTLRMVSALGMSTLGFGVLAACSSSPVCPEKSKCPNDAPISPAALDQCTRQEEEAKRQPCFEEKKAQRLCELDQTKCAENGTTDVLASREAAARECIEQASRLDACLARQRETSDGGS